MNTSRSEIGLKSYNWSSLDILKDLSIEQITLSKEKIEQRRDFFWHDMSSEYDSMNFLRYLLGREDIHLCDEFIEFICLWLLDEQNHYRGMRKINSVLFAIPENEIDKEIKIYRSNFSHISEFMLDEFSTLISIAFDEITSTRAYKQDIPLYESLGATCLSTWVRYAARDEAAHYGNAIKILRLKHAHRFSEAKSILDRIMDFETSEGFRYHRTFIFDHDTNDFSHTLLNGSRNAILEVLER